jgi:hypothetical protein
VKEYSQQDRSKDAGDDLLFGEGGFTSDEEDSLLREGKSLL